MILKIGVPVLQIVESTSCGLLGKLIDSSPDGVESWNEGAADRTFILMRRAPGEPLCAAWSKLSVGQKDSNAKETTEYLQQLRELQSIHIKASNRCSIYSSFLYPPKLPMILMVFLHPTMSLGLWSAAYSIF